MTVIKTVKNLSDSYKSMYRQLFSNARSKRGLVGGRAVVEGVLDGRMPIQV